MAYQSVFQRFELKYLLTRAQKELILAAMAGRMVPDKHGAATIRNLYYDTDRYLLVRRSIEKPAYKEKLRVRSYRAAGPDDPVFVELKKKYDSVVYKRRISLPAEAAQTWLTGQSPCPVPGQIPNEIDHALQLYQTLQPRIFLSYRREAFYAADDPNFRVTFDDQILARREALTLAENPWGTPLLPEDRVLMEIKCAGGIPLWLTTVLSREKIFKTSFSKYGTAYKTLIFPTLNRDCTEKREEY